MMFHVQSNPAAWHDMLNYRGYQLGYRAPRQVVAGWAAPQRCRALQRRQSLDVGALWAERTSEQRRQQTCFYLGGRHHVDLATIVDSVTTERGTRGRVHVSACAPGARGS